MNLCIAFYEVEQMIRRPLRKGFRWLVIAVTGFAMLSALPGVTKLYAFTDGCIAERLASDVMFDDIWHGDPETDPPSSGCDPIGPCDWGPPTNIRASDGYHSNWIEGTRTSHHEASDFPMSCGIVP